MNNTITSTKNKVRSFAMAAATAAVITTGCAGILLSSQNSVAHAESATPQTYTVKSGDTLGKIAQLYGYNISYAHTLAKINNLQNEDLIMPGQTITIASATPTTTQATASTTTQAAASSQSTATTQSTNTTASTQNTQSTQSTQTAQPAATQSTQQTAQNTQQTATTASQFSATSTASTTDESAKAWIANHESGGSYNARNGQYIGKYQLSASYLNGDYSAANQERVANQYVSSRYGSWSQAKAFWTQHGWY